MKNIIKICLVALVVGLGTFANSSNCFAQDFANVVVSVTGTITNEITHQPVSVSFVVFDEAGNKYTSSKSNASENGYYFITGLKAGKKYKFVINNKSYLKEEVDIDIPATDRYQEISKDIRVIPLEVGAAVKIPFPPFELNKSKLRVGADRILSPVISALANNPDVAFEIVSYPDNDINKAENTTLTNERVNALKEYLINNGISANRINIKGQSSIDPKNPPPVAKGAKGKRYIGTSYIVITKF